MAHLQRRENHGFVMQWKGASSQGGIVEQLLARILPLVMIVVAGIVLSPGAADAAACSEYYVSSSN